MKYLQLWRSTAIILGSVLSFLSASSVQAAGHTVKSGDTLSAISRKYGVSMRTLQKANPGIKPNLLAKGQMIRLPGKESSPVSKKTTLAKPKKSSNSNASPVLGKSMVVSKGTPNKSRSAISQAKEKELSRRQPVGDTPERRIPPKAKGIITHKVQSGETLAILARRSGVSVAELVDMNGLESVELLPNQKLVLPAAASARFRDTAEQDISIDLTPPSQLPSAPVPRRSSEPVAPPVQQGTYYHVVKNGETFYSIARDRRVSVAALIKANRSIHPNKLGKNQKLSIPGVQMAARETESRVIDEPPPARVTAYRLEPDDETTPTRENTMEEDDTVSGLTAYRVTDRDNMDSIAREFKTTPRELRRMNHLNTFDRITVGSWLMVPWQKSTAEP